MVSSSAPRRLLLTVYPPDGGAAQHVVDLALGLDANRWSLDLACLPSSEVWTKLEGRPNVRLHTLRGSHGRPTPGDFRDLLLLVQLVGEADVVHAHSSKAGFLTRLAAALRRRRDRTLFTPHAWSFWAAEGIEARLYLGLERLAAHWCRTVVAVSQGERTAGLAARVGRPEQYRVILNGIDLKPYATDPQPHPGRVVFLGRLSRQKRPDLALRALALLLRTRPEAMLEVVGDGPLRPDLVELVDREGLREAIHFLGTRHDVPALLERAACVVLTSDYEGCPLSVLEAMAAGAPVVATAVGGVPELVVDGETGLLVEPGRPDLVASALSRLLGDVGLARRMGLAGRERARTLFSRERMGLEIEDLYRDVLDGQ